MSYMYRLINVSGNRKLLTCTHYVNLLRFNLNVDDFGGEQSNNSKITIQQVRPQLCITEIILSGLIGNGKTVPTCERMLSLFLTVASARYFL